MWILDAIADGSVNLKGMCEKSKLDKSMCSKCLDKLRTVGFIESLHPMVDAPKRPVYRISDNLVDFHERVVRFRESMVYEELEGRIDTFLGFRFESMCAEFIADNYRCLEIGKWWGGVSDGVTHDIDIVAKVRNGRDPLNIYAGCKFRRKGFVASALKDFKEDVGLVKSDSPYRLMLFSVSGFSEEVIEDARMLLVDLDVLLGRGLHRHSNQVIEYY